MVAEAWNRKFEKTIDGRAFEILILNASHFSQTYGIWLEYFGTVHVSHGSGGARTKEILGNYNAKFHPRNKSVYVECQPSIVHKGVSKFATMVDYQDRIIEVHGMKLCIAIGVSKFYQHIRKEEVGD